MEFGDILFCVLLLIVTVVTMITHIMQSGHARDGYRGGAEGGLHSKLHQSASALPLPPRAHAGYVSSSSPAHPSPFSPEPRQVRVPPLPAAGRRRERAGCSRLYEKPGPGGIRPVQFPCCPIDRQRNRKGCAQKIFWDRINDCYVCSHGHHFSRNGRLC